MKMLQQIVLNRCRWEKLNTAKIFQRKIHEISRHLVDIQPEVSDALLMKRPVVALESTIITHGMPYPDNVETAIEVEEIIRQEKVVPATIAILNGRIKIGLTNDELRYLGNVNGTTVENKTLKTSRRDLPYVIGNKLNGGTTVAGTMIVANMVDIRIFATGGIGGVHRDGENTLDISADLIEMGRTPVTVVSSGVKSILDIPRTLEYLETQGVFVTSYEATDKEFPAFYTRSSGTTAPYNVNGPQEAAAIVKASIDLNLNSGMLIAVPIPKENAMCEKEINKAIDVALTDAKQKNINGKEVTPYLLAAISKITSGQSLSTNKALIKNNARVAAQIAFQLSKLMTTVSS